MVTERIVRAASPKPASAGEIQATPFQFYVAGEDSLVLNVWSSVVADVVVAGRWYHGALGIEPFRYTFTTNGATASPQAFIIRAAEGFLLNVALECTGSGVVMPGQVFTQLVIGRGGGSAFIKLGTVLQGYIGTTKFLGFPGSLLEDSLTGSGFYTTRDVNQPPAGFEWSQLVGAKRRWHVHRMFALLATSGAAGNRSPSLRVDGVGARQQMRLCAAGTQAPTRTDAWTWAVGIATLDDTANGVHTVALPTPCVFDSFDTVQSATSGLAAGDQWSAITMEYEERLVTDTVPVVVL